MRCSDGFLAVFKIQEQGAFIVDRESMRWYIVLDSCGGVAEWFKAAVLKTVVRKYRGFESYLLRHI